MARLIILILFAVIFYFVFKVGKFFGKVENTAETIKNSKRQKRVKRDTSNIDAADYEVIDDSDTDD